MQQLVKASRVLLPYLIVAFVMVELDNIIDIATFRAPLLLSVIAVTLLVCIGEDWSRKAS